MELFTKNPPPAAVDVDPGGGHVEPILGLPEPGTGDAYYDNGARPMREQSADDELAALRVLVGSTIDGMLALEQRVKTLDQQRLYVQEVWTPNDSQITVKLPADRSDLMNWVLYRIVAICTDDAAAANEQVTITNLLPVPFRVTAQKDWTAISNTIPVLDIPVRSESFVVKPSAGGVFVTKAILFADFREATLV